MFYALRVLDQSPGYFLDAAVQALFAQRRNS